MAHSLIGIDEVGRGCWAGPLLVVAARAKGNLPDNLKDSKVLSRAQRENFCKDLIKLCDFGEGWVAAAKIDELGLAQALRLGVKQALSSLGVNVDEQILMDGKVNYVPAEYLKVTTLVDADALIPIVSAAGIYAKVLRDEYMTKLKDKYPDYGFETHVGYGTAFHKQALQALGPLKEIHRMSFKPLQAFAEAVQ